jgi:mannosyltransferase OCH1-like enzyme
MIHFVMRFVVETSILKFLQKMFAVSGAFRGDICRVAALYQHGGYYVDVDIVYRDEAPILEDFLSDNV